MFDPQPPLTNHQVAFGVASAIYSREELHVVCLMLRIACYFNKCGAYWSAWYVM